jgi:2-polyprenyl-3-methyl-5-hydroxy-6-metoxy-1,4-benzoquinol methylase
LATQVAALEWYHTMELPGGVVTKGFFDHRPILDKYDLPERLDGMRALDVGTFDGLWAFELERRGAEVIAIDVPDAESLDWPAPLRKKEITRFQPRTPNFELARTALGSKVRREFVSVYDVTPEALGTFDLVHSSSILIHLRDPVGALMAMKRVCKTGGQVRICEEVHRRLDLLSRRAPLAKFQALSHHLTWWVPNRACLEQWLEAAGFVGVGHGQTFVIPFNGASGGVRHGVLWATNPD